MYLSHALRAIVRAVVVTGDALWKYVTLLISGTPPAKTFIYDASNNNTSLTLNGDTRPSNFNPYTQGYYSAYFDGSGDYLTAPSSANLAFGSGDFCVELWYYQSTSAVVGLFSNSISSGSGGDTQFEIQLDSSLRPLLVGWASVFLTSSASSTINTWNHLAVTRSGTTASMFLNGTRVATATVSNNFSSTNAFNIGRQASNGGYLTGYIANVRAVKGSSVYNPTQTTITVPTAPLTAISGTSLLTCQSNRFIDNSQNNLTITKTGDVSVRSFAPFTPPTSVNVNTLYSTTFDGSGDYLVVANSAQLSLGANDFTIEMWVMLTSSSGTLANYSNGQSATSNFGWEFYQTSATGIQFSVMEGGSQYISSASGLTAGVWNHVAGVRNGTSLKTYINGVAGGTTGNLTGVTVSDPGGASVNICSYLNGSYYTAGKISNFRIVRGTALYTANFTPPTAPLTAISGTALLTCQSSTTRDNSANALAITSFGQAQPVLISPFTQTTTAVDTTYLGSGYFDGTGDYLSAAYNSAFDVAGNTFTIEAWINITGAFATDSGGNKQGAIAVFGPSVAGQGWEFFIDQTSNILYFSAMGSNSNYIRCSYTFAQNTWYHVAMVRSGSTNYLFVNGVAQTLTVNAYTGGSATSGTLILGGALKFSGYDHYFVGYIADLRIVKGTAVYTANFAPPLQPLTAVANTQLLTLQTDIPAANKQFIDNSGSNLPITQFGNATQGTFSPYGSNWSNYFDGSGDYLTLPSSATALAMGTGSFTIEFWVYTSNVAQVGYVLQTDIGSDSLYVSFSGSTLRLTNAGTVFATTPTLINNTWYHIAVVRSGTSSVIYTNGVAGTVVSCSINFTQNGPVIGANSFIGYISNLRVIKGTAVYTANFTPPTAPLEPIAGTSLLTCQSSRIVDNSLNAFTITKTGDVSARNFSPFSPVTQTPVSYSATFGSTGYLTSTTSTAFPIGTENFTVEMWLYKTNSWTNNNQVLLISSTSGSLQIWVDSGTGLLKVTYNSVSEAVSCSTSSLAINTWYHFAVTRSGNNFTIYINGTSVATGTNSASFATPSSIIVANYTSGTSDVWNGYISNLRIVRGTVVYTANFTPPTAPLTAISGTSLLTCQSPVIVDNSPNAFAITGNGNVAAKTFHPFGITSYSQYFDGSGDYLSVPNNAALTLGAGNFTVECWFYIAGNSASNPSSERSGQLITKIQDTSNYYSLYVLGNSTTTGNALRFEYAVGGATITVQYTATIAQGQWHHLAVVRNGSGSSNVVMYLNGTSVVTATITATDSNTGAVNIGYYGYPSYPNHFYGYISNARIVKGTAVYTANFAPPTAPLIAVANTALLTCQNLTAIDNSPNAFTITKSGNVSGSLNNPFPANAYTYTTGQSYTPALYGGSAYFDGSGDYLVTPSSNQFQFGGNLTIEFWVNFTTVAGTQDLIGNYVSNVSTDWIVIMSGTGIQFYPSGSSSYVYSGASSVTTNTWYHVAAVRSGSTCSLYINGASVGTPLTVSTTIGDASKPVYIGARSGPSSFFSGYIADLRIVKGQALYVAGFIPPAAPLQAVKNTTLLLNMDKAGAADSSRTFDFETVGDAKVRYETPYAGSYYSNYFDGTGDYLTVPTNAAFGYGTGDFTIEFWMYPSNVAADQTVFSNLSSGSSVNPHFYILGGSNVLRYYTNSADRLSSAALSSNTWYHIALTRASGSTKLFVNGVQAGSAYADANDYGASAPAGIGTYWSGGSPVSTLTFSGTLTNVRTVKGTAVYTANFTPPTAPLTAISGTSFLTCQSRSLVDSSPNALTITRTGDVAVRAFNPFQAATYSSVYFDGSGDYLTAPSNPGYQFGTGDFTVEGWLYLTGNQNFGAMFISSTTGTGNALHIQINNANKVRVTNETTEFLLATNAIPTNTWVYVAVVRSGTTLSIYQNGVLNGSTTNSTNFTQNGAVVGYEMVGSNFYYAGYIADLRITKAARYTATFTPPTAPLPTA